MSSHVLLKLNVRELALVYEQMHAVMEDESYHQSERDSAEATFDRCGELMGREEGAGATFPDEKDQSDLGWNRY